MKITYVTGNWAKIKSARQILEPLGFEVDNIKMDTPELQDDSIENVAKYSAKWSSDELKCDVLKNDSGLCIDALKGAPGIHSARYAETPQARIDRVLSEMQAKENRSARFQCCMTLLNPKGEIAFSHTGICEGSIIESQRGVNGFGYDPIFLLKNSNKTMAELSEQDKNKVSHRFKALREVLNYLANIS